MPSSVSCTYLPAACLLFSFQCSSRLCAPCPSRRHSGIRHRDIGRNLAGGPMTNHAKPGLGSCGKAALIGKPQNCCCLVHPTRLPFSFLRTPSNCFRRSIQDSPHAARLSTMSKRLPKTLLGFCEPEHRTKLLDPRPRLDIAEGNALSRRCRRMTRTMLSFGTGYDHGGGMMLSKLSQTDGANMTLCLYECASVTIMRLPTLEHPSFTTFMCL